MVVAGGLLGVLIGLIALRLEGDYLAIVTLFVGQAFVEVVNNVDPGTFGGNNGLSRWSRFTASAGRSTPGLLLRGADRHRGLILRSCTCSTAREPAAPGARCATTRSRRGR